MAESGDQPLPETPVSPSAPTAGRQPLNRAARAADHGSADHGAADHADDDLVGFTSPASLIASPAVSPRPSDPDPVVNTTFARPVPERVAEPEPDALATPLNRLAMARDGREAVASAFPPSATERQQKAAMGQAVLDRYLKGRSAAATDARPVTREASRDGGMILFAIYALILSAVPTLGVAAVVALLAVTFGASTQGGTAQTLLAQSALARSHFEFQKRTLWIAGIVAVAGVVLIAVNLGVFVLFIAAVWLMVRGTWGLLLLARGEPIEHPHQWLIAGR